MSPPLPFFSFPPFSYHGFISLAMLNSHTLVAVSSIARQIALFPFFSFFRQLDTSKEGSPACLFSKWCSFREKRIYSLFLFFSFPLGLWNRSTTPNRLSFLFGGGGVLPSFFLPPRSTKGLRVVSFSSFPHQGPRHESGFFSFFPLC